MNGRALLGRVDQLTTLLIGKEIMDAFHLKLALAPVICALIGWLTNYLAVKMLFHPRKPVKILFYTMQGIFPKRQKALARNLGEMVQGELISHEDVVGVLQDKAFLDKVRTMSGDYADSLVRERLVTLHPMIGMFLNDEMAEKIKDMLGSELESLIPRVVEEASRELESKLDFKEMVREKVEAFSMDKLESILFAIMRQEFRFIELVGGVLGFMVGLVQAAIFAL